MRLRLMGLFREIDFVYINHRRYGENKENLGSRRMRI